MEELIQQRENRIEAREALDSYSNEACKDRDFMEYLNTNDKETFKEMNERFNELARGRMENAHKDVEIEV